MFSYFCATGTRRFGALLAVTASVVTASLHRPNSTNSAEPLSGASCCSGPSAAALARHPSLDLFDAMRQGAIEARIIVRDPYHAKLLLTNRTATPQTVQLPDVLAARPVLAQQQGSFFGPQPGGNNVGSTGAIAPQTVGGTPTSSNSNSSNSNGFPSIFNGNGLNNVFNVAPEQVRIVEIMCLCLEQGKPNPRSAVTYELTPLAEVSDDPRLPEVLLRYGRGEVNREAAQAAAWHLANEMSWEKLAALSQKIAVNAERPWFRTSQLHEAKRLVETARPKATVKVERTVKAPRL